MGNTLARRGRRIGLGKRHRRHVDHEVHRKRRSVGAGAVQLKGLKAVPGRGPGMSLQKEGAVLFNVRDKVRNRPPEGIFRMPSHDPVGR